MLRLKAVRQDRYTNLVAREVRTAEIDDLYAKLGGDVESDWRRREALGRWLAAAKKQRRWAWQN